MKQNNMKRYENVKSTLKIVDLKIRNQLKNNDTDMNDLLNLIKVRDNYIDELKELDRNIKIKETFKKENGYKG